MPFLRSAASYILSFIFISSILLAITSYDIGNLLQKNYIKSFITSQMGPDFIREQCQNKCEQYQDLRENCTQFCVSDLTNQTQTGIDKALNEIYDKKLFNFSLNEFTLFLADYPLFFVVGIISGILLLFASLKPLSTLGKDFVSISFSLLITSIIPQFMTASVNLPIDLGQSINNYFSSAFNQLLIYGVIFLTVGLVLILINYALDRRKIKKDQNKKK